LSTITCIICGSILAASLGKRVACFTIESRRAVLRERRSFQPGA
jgi:hypothetical protein